MTGTALRLPSCRAALAGFVLAAMPFAVPAFAQSVSADPGTEQSAAPPGGGIYKPPLRGAPGGRVGGASRGAKSAASLPTIELIAPLDHTGETASATLVLYFFVSQPVMLPTQFTISAPLRPKPIVEATIPAPPARGLYALRLADYRAQLDPGIVYTWSVSVIVDPRNWSRNVVASATVLRVPPDARVEGATGMSATPNRRAALLAGAGLWYDAVAAAADGEDRDRHAALDELLTEVGLTTPAGTDRASNTAPPILR